MSAFSVRRARARAGAGAVLTGAAALVLAGPVPAADAAACSGTTGVTVVVDFGSLGGIQVGCAAGDPSSGLAALHGAGFGTTGTQKDGPSFVCRINGAPASDPCVVTPPPTAYWSYWHAPPGGSWSYSSLGAAGYNPAPGSVEGWAFGAGARPGIAPPTAPAPPPAPKPTTQPAPAPAPTSSAAAPPPATAAPPRTTAAGGGGTAPGVPGAPRTSTGTRAPAAGTPAGSATLTASATSGSAAASSRPPSASEAATEPPPGTVPPTSDPGPLSAAAEPVGVSTPFATFALGAAIVAALAVAGAFLARRRRAPGPPV